MKTCRLLLLLLLLCQYFGAPCLGGPHPHLGHLVRSGTACEREHRYILTGFRQFRLSPGAQGDGVRSQLGGRARGSGGWAKLQARGPLPFHNIYLYIHLYVYVYVYVYVYLYL